MEYIRLRQINGAGVCYEDTRYRAESRDILEARYKKMNSYHDGMPGRGYCERTWLTRDYQDKVLIADVLAKELNKEIKVTYERYPWHSTSDGNVYKERMVPVSKDQKKWALGLIIDWKRDLGIIYQARERLHGTVREDGVVHSVSQKEMREGKLPIYIEQMVDLLQRTRLQIRDMDQDYKELVFKD